MERGFNSFMVDQEDHENSPENSEDSPPSSVLNDTKTTSTSSPKRSRRAMHKRVVSVPIKDVEGSRLKGETNAPPSDAWAWRKYGQKPIKGSPYPRGYYRCSSSKGCPARKQVERSRADPTMVVVTYSCEHNHPWPASRNNHHHHTHNHNQDNSPSSPPAAATTTATTASTSTTAEATVSNTNDPIEEPQVFATKSEPDPDEKFTGLEVGPGGPFITTSDQYGWFSDLESASSTMLESPLMAGDMVGDADMAMIFSIREEDEAFFADLGELPECSTVFRRKEMEREEEHHHHHHRGLAPWCGTTG